MKIKVLHVVGGSLTNGAAKGANVLHEALLSLKIDSKLLNDSTPKVRNIDKKIIFINDTFFKRIINNIFVYLEKILKSIFLHAPRETFTLGFFGFDITKLKEYKNADIIHIHWLNQGFIKLGSLSKINKPLVWTMRDMWSFTGGSHYTMDFEKYEKSYISKIIKNFKKKNYNKNFHFIAVSDWLRNKAQKSSTLKEYDIKRIYNNINTNDFDIITKKQAKSFLKISTKKKIILYGAQNPQSKRKGWSIFIRTLKKLDNTKYFLLIFGNFWSQESLDKIGIEYKSLGFINDKKILNNTYSSADLFVASSIEDAWPKTFAEAMYCGTPVVCFDNTSISEIVDHKVNGYIVKNFDADLLKKGIDWLSKEIMKNSFNKNSSRIKISNFSGDVIAKKYIKFYKKILK
ncbi:glycosyltransferase [Candidatus Pelagibacter sp.]|nr:glycosyltransferase [Candidatus Pelagibacter sp.]